MVAIHSPEGEITVCSTRAGSSGCSSRREILFEGETSNSDISFEYDGEYIWSDDGCDDGRIRVEVMEWTARDAVIGAMCDEGS